MNIRYNTFISFVRIYMDKDTILYEYVMEEIEKNDLQKGLWAKALALSEGNNDKAKSLYMQYRVQAIKEELNRLHIDPSSLSPQRIWHILANGITPEEQASFQEEREEQQKLVHHKQEQEKYGKIRGWLLVFAILLVIGDLSYLEIFELFTSEYKETMQELFIKASPIFSYMNTTSYILFLGLFFNILLTISFFAKYSSTRSIAIVFFIFNILSTIIQANLFFDLKNNIPDEIFNAMYSSNEIIKEFLRPFVVLIISLVWIFYFIYSKRVKKTFTNENDVPPALIVIPLIMLGILFTKHNSHMNEIEKNATNLKYEYFNLGYKYSTGEKQDYLKAAEYYKISCDYGNADACNNLGALYQTGNGVSQDYLKAAELYEKALNIGSATACKNLAVLYSNGLGVKRDYLKAKELYERACNGGDKEACSKFEYLNDEKNGYYDIGKNYSFYSQDYKKAKEYFDISCRKGNQKACLEIGHIYSKGLGIVSDESKALEFYQKACDGKDADGCYFRNNLSVKFKKANAIKKQEPETKFTCEEIKSGDYSMDDWKKRARLREFNKYHEGLLSQLCKGDTEGIQWYIDNDYVLKSEVESIIKILGLKFDIEIKNQSEEGKRIVEARNKFYGIGLCSACASNSAYYFVVEPNSKCRKIARKALEGDKQAIEEASNIGSGDYCK